MSDIAENQVAAPASVYDELPDAPPKRKLKFTVVGKIAITIVTFWVVLAFLGPFASPYHEADIIADDSFTEPGETCSEYEEGLCSYHILGTDYLGRDTLSRIMWGAREPSEGGREGRSPSRRCWRIPSLCSNHPLFQLSEYHSFNQDILLMETGLHKGGWRSLAPRHQPSMNARTPV